MAYLALELCAVDDVHRFVERVDIAIGVRLLLRTCRFMKLWSTVRWEVCGQPECWARG